jgi:muramoyltetrapeptide carboxypeptidase
MKSFKPLALNKGDTIGIIALSGAVDKENILRAKVYFEKKGFKVVLSENIFDKKRYLAGEDEKKVEELHKFFKNPEIKMILCARGGYGAIRLLDKIDFEVIKNNPKIFAGYSDATALLAMIYKKTGLVTFHSPMAQGDFGIEKVSPFVEKNFFNAISGGSLVFEPCKRRGKTYFKGEAKGILWGGNLATLASLCGLDFVPDEKFILFIEDLNEEVYKIDKALSQLLNVEKFKKNLQGIILGDFLNIDNKKYFDELFFEIGEKIQKPIQSGFKITHGTEKITLPYGVEASFSTETKVLKIENYLNV